MHTTRAGLVDDKLMKTEKTLFTIRPYFWIYFFYSLIYFYSFLYRTYKIHFYYVFSVIFNLLQNANETLRRKYLQVLAYTLFFEPAVTYSVALMLLL